MYVLYKSDISEVAIFLIVGKYSDVSDLGISTQHMFFDNQSVLYMYHTIGTLYHVLTIWS